LRERHAARLVQDDRARAGAPDPNDAAGLIVKPDLFFSLALLAVATVAVVLAYHVGDVFWPPGLPTLFFFGFGLLTISMGYAHPREGYVSFDRVAQVASILVLGPVPAAIINGLASLVFPWHRLRHGVPVGKVLDASVHNAGLMTVTVLVGGLVYDALGGAIPLSDLDGGVLLPLLMLFVTMQVVNEVGMRVSLSLRDRRWVPGFNITAFLIETAAGLAGVLVAVVMNHGDPGLFALLLLVLSLGMLYLTQFARMRLELEAIVESRTQALKDQASELERLATHDKLTGLYNRRFADDYLDDRLAEFNRYRRNFAVALVDLDHFKSINDNFSHNAGDAVLMRVARILKDRCRASDMVSRYGGEEFLLCFPETDVEDARDLCEELRQAVAAADWGDEVPGIAMSISAGVAGMRPGLTRMALLSNADARLYEAKAAGRNRVI
jgi:diguanylate cyclase (GGDEF)-like protein